MGQVVVNGQVLGETNSIIEIEPMYSDGIHICDITIDGHKTEIYIPDNSQQNNGGE